ncbi:interleukin-15 receptor subunit alpha-like isoform X2 [Gambusia affinis]|uniref:interleukin-15 receptor subunit alpha-like isoform X2 n=1 Tax=Gambusia affinis TaxID=33528 RepID=UPI001CDCAD08|nr:interleukin-15 receptor subunit alpha-like isoform X2 [Gambusia affinis]
MNVSLLNDPEIVQRIKRDWTEYMEHNDNGEVSVSTLWEAGKAVLRGQCTCPEIPRRNFTLQPEAENCFNVGYKYRYSCIPGYVRKAGTSNLITCSNDSKWTTTRHPLVCIQSLFKPPDLFLSDLDVNELAFIVSAHPDSTTPSLPHIPDGLSITTAAPNRPETSTSYSTGRSSTTETTSSANMKQSTSVTKSTTTVVSYKTRSSTYSPSNHSNGNSSMKDIYAETYTADAKTIAITLSAVILLASTSGIIFLLYRRRKRPIPPQETEEMQPINNSS